MKSILQVEMKTEVLSLASGISYACVSDWYDETFRDLKMDLVFPKHREGHPKQPTILWICGGAFSVVSEDVWMPEMVDYARMGYTVASINYRTSNQAIFPACLMDAKAAIRFLKAHADQFCIDREHIFVMGESAGGTLASLVGVTAGKSEFEQGDYLEQDSSVAGVIDFYGLADLTSKEVLQPSVYVPEWTIPAFLGSGFSAEDAKRASAISYVDHPLPPFLIFHGDADQVVSLGQSDAFYETLINNGTKVDYYVLQNAGHGEDPFYQTEIKEIVNRFIRGNCGR